MGPYAQRAQPVSLTQYCGGGVFIVFFFKFTTEKISVSNKHIWKLCFVIELILFFV